MTSFVALHCADTVPPSDAAKGAIGALLSALSIPNPKVYGAQGSAALAPGVNLYAYAHKYGFLPDVAAKQAVFVAEEQEWRGLGVNAGAQDPSYAPEPLHFRVDQHLTIAEIHPDAAVRTLAWNQAAESIAILMATKLCLPGQPFTNPRGYGWGMEGLRNWWLVSSAPDVVTAWFTCLQKLYDQKGWTDLLALPYLTEHPAGGDHGNQKVCTWMTGRAALAVAMGVRAMGGYGNHAQMDAVAHQALNCLVHAAAEGEAMTGLSGRLVDDYNPLAGWLKPGYEAKYGVMSRWAYPAVLELTRAGVPGAQAFLEGPIHDAFLADNMMKPSEWKVGNGYGSLHMASIATQLAPWFTWRQ